MQKTQEAKNIYQRKFVITTYSSDKNSSAENRTCKKVSYNLNSKYGSQLDRNYDLAFLIQNKKWDTLLQMIKMDPSFCLKLHNFKRLNEKDVTIQLAITYIKIFFYAVNN